MSCELEKSHASGRSAPVAPPLPELGLRNNELSPEVFQHRVDCAAHFNMFSIPDASASSATIPAPGVLGGIIGMRISEALHRFEIVTYPPEGGTPLTARNIIGEAVGKFNHRWVLMPDDFTATADREPPPTVLVPSKSQRFVMLDGLCTFGDGQDGFRGFGCGRTLPTIVNGRSELLVTAVGAIIEGFGKFKDHDEGTYVYCGTLAPERGFTGNVLLRVVDVEETIRTENALPAIEAIPHPDPETVYLLFRGQAIPADPVTPRLAPDGRPAGLTVDQSVRLLTLDFKAGGRRGLQSTDRIGPLTGKITAHVTFDPSSPGGAVSNPIPFTSYDEFVFFDRQGSTIGAVTATSTEGRVFHTQIGGRQGLRFGGVGSILSGTGSFENITGLMTDNSVVLFTPHVSASVYVLRINDPQRRFRAGACAT
jgi:hypothetical protein